MKGKVCREPQIFVGIGLADDYMPQKVIDIESRDKILLVEADAFTIFPVHLLWNCHIKERIIVIRIYCLV